LAALLANDGARVFSADLDGVQEFNRRKVTSGSTRAATAPHHIVTPTLRTVEHCLSISDVVVSGVPSPEYQVPTEHLKDGVVAVNFSSEKNFQPDIKDKVGRKPRPPSCPTQSDPLVGFDLRSCDRQGHYHDASA
jgi:methylenetetrahydrofolate dehydrogenase (NAD+)